MSLAVGWVHVSPNLLISTLLLLFSQCSDRECECIYVKSRRGGARYPRGKRPLSNANTSQQRRSPSDQSFLSDVEREWECEFYDIHMSVLHLRICQSLSNRQQPHWYQHVHNVLNLPIVPLTKACSSENMTFEDRSHW